MRARFISADTRARGKWDDERGVWRGRPRHDWASHGADVFRTMATRFRDVCPTYGPPKPKHVDKPVMMALPGGDRIKYVTSFSMIEWAEPKRKQAERDR